MDGKPIYRSKKKMGKRVGGGFVPKKEDQINSKSWF